MLNKGRINNDITKDYICRQTIVQSIIKETGMNQFESNVNTKPCTFGDICRGAHSIETMKIKPHIYQWKKIDKSKFDFINIHMEVLKSIKENKQKMFPNNIFSERVSMIDGLNFIELINLWRELACYYRKIGKELPRKNSWKLSVQPKPHVSGYIFSDEIPYFSLNDIEDYIWGFERVTILCKKEQVLKKKINDYDTISMNDICLSSSNCKDGVHNIDELLCISDFLTGSCECEKKESFDMKHSNLIQEKQQLTNKLQNNLYQKDRDIAKNALNKISSQINKHKRKLHYTDDGMIPYNIQYSEYVAKKNLERKQKEEQINSNPQIWEHNIIENTQSSVRKISLKKKV